MHRQPWPTAEQVRVGTADPAMVDAVSTALAGLRGVKSTAKVSMRTELASATVSGPADQLALAEQAAEDLRAAGKITGGLTFDPTGDAELTVSAEIAPQPA